MSIFFVDTSSLAKWYVTEVGSAWVISWLEQSTGNVIIVAQLTIVEMFALLARRQREGTLTANNVFLLQNEFSLHVEGEYLIVPLDEAVISRARNLVTRYPLRTLDSIQLACAIEATTILSEPLTFISGDNNLLTAAAAEGFVTDNPYAHP